MSRHCYIYLPKGAYHAALKGLRNYEVDPRRYYSATTFQHRCGWGNYQIWTKYALHKSCGVRDLRAVWRGYCWLNETAEKVKGGYMIGVDKRRVRANIAILRLAARTSPVSTGRGSHQRKQSIRKAIETIRSAEEASPLLQLAMQVD